MTDPKHSDSPGYSNFVLGALFVVYIFNFVDRQILAILIQPIKEDLGVSDTMMGILTGPVFVITYMLAGLPLARWADRHSRVWLITGGLVVWSAMTVASGMARNFIQLAAARLGVGLGEASFTPAAHSLIADYFPPQRRATALAIFAAGASLGSIAGYLGGGYIGQYVGWHEAFLYVGFPGLIAAVIFRLTVRDPVRGAYDAPRTETRDEPLREVLGYLMRRRSFVFIVASAMLHGFSSYGAGYWVPTFLIRVHHLSLSEVGVILGAIVGVAGFGGQIIGGRISDLLGNRDPRWYMWTPAIASVVALPFLVAFLLLPDLYWAVGCYTLGGLAVNMWTGPTYAMAQGVAKPHMRSMAAAIVIFMLNLVGAGLGPLIVGILNDWLDPRFGVEAVRYSLLIVIVPHTLASIFNLMAARTLREDLREASA
ncbi:MAG: MFS transporter [Deltaproteobacteria bacterium]|nr:MFS transporter [Deltaproteobacteria bacterium]MBW2232367.1 MFS transporter [Deltaproteobacteria bacterium]